jgi:superfamily I DNA/RNA helicase
MPDPPRHRNEDYQEDAAIGRWIEDLRKAGVLPHEFGVFVRSDAQLDRARAALRRAGLPFKVLDDQVDIASGQVLLRCIWRRDWSFMPSS